MRHPERGSVTPLIIGLAAVLLLGIAVVVDATAAYLQRSSLSSLADGAALRGADLGATGVDVYEGGVPAQQLALTREQAAGAVADYLRQVGAYDRFPGLSYQVDVDATSVSVRVAAPLDLPLTVPGAPGRPRVAATGSAVVDVQAAP